MIMIMRDELFEKKAKQKNMRVSGYMLLKIRVGRSGYFLIF